jgi:DNA mismatch repair protein MutS2
MKYHLDALEFDQVLHKLSNYAKTDYAKELISKLTPNSNFEEVLELNNETNEAYLAVVRQGDIPLGGLYNVNPSIRRSQIGGILDPNELLNIVYLLDCSMNVTRYFKSLESIKLNTPCLNKYVDKLVNLPTLKTNITLAINPDGKVNDNASRELFTIRRTISSLNNRLKSKLNELMTSRASMLTDNLIVMRNNRMCLPVKIEYKNTFKGIIHDISSSNTTCYIEPEATIETANQIDSYINKEKKEIEVILKNLTLLVSAESDILLTNLDSLTNLDIIYSKALMGKELDYSNATIVNDYSFNLKKAKHPLIDRDKVVPIDVELGKKAKVIIITGPNTGGKTVALKTVGLLHCMAMCGMMVPCSSDSVLSVFNEILVDIGDEQSIAQSLSTFSAHMKKMNEILEATTFESLILLDELGSGTDPKEGSSLAISMINYMKSRGATIIVTTHYSDLKTYAYNTDNVLNASVEFNTNTLMPTYRLLVGVPGKSNAIEIAKRLGIPEEIINSSKSYMDDISNSENSELMNNLEEEITKLRQQEEELAHKIEMYDELNHKLSIEKVNLTKQTNKIISDAKNEANNIIKDAKDEASKLINEIKELSNVEYKEHELADLKYKVKNLNVEANDLNLFDEELVVGDYVYIKPYEKNGTITKIKKDKYTVQMGQFSMDFAKSDLTKAAKPKEKVVKQSRLSGYNPASHASLSLDLRGKRYEEVKDLMDQYLDQAILGNLETVTIIHGFGTGVIRNAVQDYLKKCPYVKSYRYGGEGEGLNGATVVKLK